MDEATKNHAKHRKRIEHAQRGTARAALLGISDGLVTNVSLILGIAGANATPDIIRVAGLASLIAGACSMAVGEYISMRGQAELLGSALEVERLEFRREPTAIQNELQAQLEADGVSHATAVTASKEIINNPKQALSLYARAQLGVNPDQLGSPWSAAGSSFVMFSVGAAIPLLPWLFTSGVTATIISIVAAVIAALAIGSYLGYSTNGRVVRSALRQVSVLILAAAITYTIGRLLHTRIS